MIAVAATLVVESAAADDAPGDPLVPTAVAETGAGAAIVLAGAGVIANAHGGDQRCGKIAGCVDAVVDDGADRDGRYLVGTGLGLATVGGITWAVTAGAPLEPGEQRDSNGGTIAGSILVALGASGTGAIIAGSTSPYHEAGWNVLIASAAIPSLAVGIPLLATSADGETREQAAAEEDARRNGRASGEMRSPGMFGAGVALTTVGGVGLGAATVLVVAGGAGSDLYALVYGGVVAAPSAALLAVGIPLTVVGGGDPDPPSSRALAPRVRVGLGSLDVSGSF